MHELRDADEPELSSLLAHLAPCDLVLIEGFKRDDHPKIEVLRKIGPDGRIADSDTTVRAVVTQDAALARSHRCLALDDIDAIADFICVECGLDFRI